ncbi:lysylphosphatidylglycerol synthase transmembrane domain-containing protein [Stomatohabitans albus]|uniref:lysylphosphatidylglycerol synthase transmembrane domain-containing protein n=1 Tax=Stomatohabitans albus TaxID=3110766 RepID=UPI00300C1A0F
MKHKASVHEVLRVGVGLVTLVGCLWILYITLDGNWAQAWQALTPVVGGVSLVSISLHAWANAMLAAQWGRMLDALGSHLPRATVAWLWTRAQLTRFAIGSAGLVSRPLLARSQGVPLDIGTSTTVLESVWLMAMLGMGLPFAATLLPAVSIWVWVAGAGCALLVIGLTVMPSRVLRPLQWVRPTLVTTGLEGHGWRITRGYISQIVLRAAVFVLLAIAINPSSATNWMLVVGAFVLSYLVGWLFIFSPGGLGPREAVAGLVLSQAGLESGQVIALVALARVVEVLGELLYVSKVQRPEPTEDAAAQDKSEHLEKGAHKTLHADDG